MSATAAVLAERIVRTVLKYRRTTPHNCQGQHCPLCIAPFVAPIMRSISASEPAQFMLLAYPFKAANPSKVLGELADMAELVSLQFLHCICNEVRAIYDPGACFIIGADGRAFADIIPGVGDSTVTRYAASIKDMLSEHDLGNISFMGLDELFPEIQCPNQLRSRLPEQEDRETLSLRARADEEFCYQVNGITKFMRQDLIYSRPDLSDKQKQKLARDIAYQIIGRGDALRALFTRRFPHAVRCSVHPQKTHSSKIGIGLVPSCDNWLTPWHAVAVERNGTFTLAKRQDAGESGAHLVYDKGRPSHFLAA